MKTLTTWQNFAADSGKAVTTWNYDANRGWLVSKQYNGTNGPSYQYTPAGRLTQRTWARGVVTGYTNDNAGRLVAIGYSDGTPAVGYTYNRAGRPVAASNSAAAYGFRYDGCGRLVGETNSVADAILIRSYDAFGRPSGLSLASDYEVDYGYDPAGRFAAVTGTVASATSVATYGYVANSDLLAGYSAHVAGSSASLTVSRGYDNLGRTLFVSNTVGGSTVSAYSYQYNAANQRTRIDVGGSATPLSGSWWEHGYDSLGQVTNSVRRLADSAAVSGQRFGYRYDDIGNRTHASSARPEDPEVYSASLLNQYTQRTVPRWIDLLGSAHTGAVVTVKSVVATGAPPAYTRAVRQKDYFHASVPVSTNGAAEVGFDIFAVLGNAGSNGEDAVSTETGSKFIAPTPEVFTYDADGNLLSDGRFAYTWDGENRLVGASNAATRILFAYDPMSRRVGKTVIGGPASGFVYDGWNLIREVKTQSGSAATNAYIWGLDLSQSLQGAGGVGGLLCVLSSTNSLQPSAYLPLCDANGNVTDYVSSDGTTAAHYEYDPFGATLAATGPMAKNFAHRFSTKYWDSETGLYYYGHRYYHPELGRWLSRDPMGEVEGANLVRFVSNCAMATIDVVGLAIYYPGDPGYPEDLPRGPGESDFCGEGLSGASGWVPDGSGPRRACSKKFRLSQWDWRPIGIPVPVIGWLDPSGNAWIMPPSIESYLATARLSWQVVAYHEEREVFAECNCRGSEWQWRRSEDSSGRSMRSKYVAMDEYNAWSEKAATFAVFDAGDHGKWPDPSRRADAIKERWEREAARMNTMANTCPEFNVWSYK